MAIYSLGLSPPTVVEDCVLWVSPSDLVSQTFRIQACLYGAHAQP